MKVKFTWILTLFTALTMQFSFAQEKIISGIVSDAISGPIPGVNVIVKGTKTGVQTDFDGKYSVKAKTGDVLVFSYMGMQDMTAIVGSSSVINMKMQEDGKALDEVVVMGYVTKTKSNMTGSSKQLSGNVLSGIPTVSVDQALQGKVVGLQVSSSSGTPGSVQDIRIRGTGSISANNQPLYVIDGVPVISGDLSGGNDNKTIQTTTSSASSMSVLATLNSHDIESVTVLKDASATAAYGARGSNGVIVITTKRGKVGKPSYNFSNSIGFQNNAVTGRRPLTGDQRKELYLDAVYNTYGASKGFDRMTAENWLLNTPEGLSIDASKASLQDWDGVSHNWGELLKNKDALVQNTDFSVSAGDEKTTFNASLGYNKTEATVRGAEFRRFTATIGVTRKLSETLKFSTANFFSEAKQNGILEGTGTFSNPNLTKYFMNPWVNPYNSDGTYNIGTGANVSDIGYWTSLHNTFYTLANNVKTNNLLGLRSNNTLDWKISNHFKYKSVFAVDYNMNTYHNYNNRLHGDGRTRNGSIEQSIRRNTNLVSQNSINYTLKLDKHNFDATALFEHQKNKNDLVGGYGENIASDDLIYLDVVSKNKRTIGNFSDWLNVSYLGLFNYNYNNKYVLDATYRREGSSKFAPKHRFGNFWSVGAAWNINNEVFMQGSVFNNLKLRTSYGTSGNSGINENSYQRLIAFDASYDAEPVAYPSTIGNELLTWEKNKTIDVGLEFGLFKNRLSGSVSYYNRDTYDLLQNVPVSLTQGVPTGTSVIQLMNAGAVLNQGIEVELNVDIFRGKDFNWSISGNYSHNDNEVKKLAKDPAGKDIEITTGTKVTKVGESIGTWNMRKWAGVDPANGLPLWYVNGVDGETTSVYNNAKVAMQGKSAPVYSGGFGTHFDYKGIYLDVSFYFAGGHKVYEDWTSYTQSTGDNTFVSFNGTENLMDRWQKPGDIVSTPKMELGAGRNAATTSTRFLYDGDYIRMKDLVLGYRFGPETVKFMSLAGLDLSLRGTNLLTFVKDGKMKYDPEVRADGFTSLVSPPVKSVVFAINIKL
ncbi:MULTISPECIES: SusC/RagA family TonB-linked outer membrane protein [unclassified Flavobacterium]|uniref:SusC/RagA family TonB-linked outer membrane protein n=1 Tax=unclassified Flavobacterium TaxID=196869 RepID=UPI000F0BEA4E|nr:MULTISPECIES: SusC/RagA family TonB-linked outer membrane protein [unclassified Flavobacterium]AYN02867.1 SusC/RagA family TonB-linked outer membrane protein [Flavobacterium sp. 140616W15]MCD0473089.1 SusC/RagA family TonB-linked outer membrane protein [Flavobacterium sp. EDS]